MSFFFFFSSVTNFIAGLDELILSVLILMMKVDTWVKALELYGPVNEPAPDIKLGRSMTTKSEVCFLFCFLFSLRFFFSSFTTTNVGSIITHGPTPNFVKDGVCVMKPRPKYRDQKPVCI